MSDARLTVDCAILGFGIAAVGAALELASQRRSSVVIIHPHDSVCFRGMVTVLPTPLNGRQVTGNEFDDLAISALDGAGVSIAQPHFFSLTRSNMFELSIEAMVSGPRRIFADRIIFAPAGTDPITSIRPDMQDYFGTGVSTDAWSDAASYKKTPIAIVGCGSRAIEQCFLVSRYASCTTLLCAESQLTPSAQRWLELMPKPFQLDQQFGVRVVSVSRGKRGHLRQIVVQDGSGERTLEISALFFAHELSPDWSVLGNRSVIDDLIAQKAIIPAGLAAGVPYDDHEALFNDGVRAAKDCG